MDLDILTISYLILGLAIAGGAAFFITKKIHRKYFLETLKLRVLLVKLAQKTEKNEKEDPLKEINLSSQLLSELGDLNIPFSLEMAVHHIGEEIHFYVGVPVDSIQFATKQIHGLWNDASIKETEDYNIFNHQGINQGVFL